MINLRKPNIVGKPMARVEGQLKASGQARYLDDMSFALEPLYARLVLSQRPHARIEIDTAEAESIPGVVRILTGRELTGVMGHRLYDRRVLPHDLVRYVGEPVAVVAATTPEAAERAARSVRISYVELPGVFGITEALDPEAPLLHPDLGQYHHLPIARPQPGSNIAHESRATRGDLNVGWQMAAVLVESTYTAPSMHHMAMEPHGVVAMAEADGRITVWASTQAPFLQRQMISEALGLDPERLRVLTAFIGGGFGGKTYVSIEAVAVAMAVAIPGRPVKLVLSRSEDFTSTFVRPGLVAHLKMAATSEGDLTALEATYHWDAGASADAMIEPAWNATYAGCGPYRIPHVSVTSRAVYTNRVPAAPMRGNGMAEVQWAVEQHIDKLAEALSIDAVAFRLQNCLKGGDILFDGRKMHATGLDVCLRRVAGAVRWSSPPARSSAGHKRRAKGVAMGWNPVLSNTREARAVIRLDAEYGPILVALNGVDVGQGFYTVAVQLVASTLGTPLAWVHVQPYAELPPSGHDQAPINQLTWSAGNAIVAAANALRSDILSWTADTWNEAQGALDIVEGFIVSHATGRSLSLRDYTTGVAADATGASKPRVLHGEGAFLPLRPDSPALTGTADESAPLLPFLQIGIGAQAVEVEVDLETGEVQALHLAAAFDVGHAINPDIVEAQIRGGAVQGLSAALFEQMVFDQGHPRNPNLADYRIASTLDIPASVEPLIVEVPQDDGPFGARGVGEHSSIAVAPALANAIYRATGVRLDSLPVSSESVWLALQSKTNASR